MCRAGIRHCKNHPSSRSVRAARRFFGAGGNTVANRQHLETLPEEYVYGKVGERSDLAATTDDQRVIAVALLDKPAVRDAVLRNPHADPVMLDERAETRALKQTFDILENPTTPASTLERLVTEGAPTVRTEAMKNLVKRGKSLDSFSANSSPKIRAMVASQTRDLRLRDALLSDSSPTVRERALLNRNFGNAPLPLSVASDSSPKVKAIAAGMNDRAVLRRLAQDEDVAIASKARKNPSRPDFERPRVRVAADVSKYASLAEIAADPRASEEQIMTAYTAPSATDADRLALARHPRSSVVMQLNHLDSLGGKWHEYLAEESGTDPRILNRLARSRSINVRLAVAMNTSTRKDALELLAKSQSAVIADTARARLGAVVA